MNKPTCQEIYDELLGDPVHTEDDASWRPGFYRTSVYFREEDKTYWMVGYRQSTCGETNELREGTAEITQVEPYEITTTAYRKIKQ